MNRAHMPLTFKWAGFIATLIACVYMTFATTTMHVAIAFAVWAVGAIMFILEHITQKREGAA